jgi:putative glycosyltransferase (TIGR04372 family)
MGSIVSIVDSCGLGDMMEVSLRLCAMARHFPEHQVYAFVRPKSYDEACSFLLNSEIDYLFSADRITDKFLSWMPWLGEKEAWTLKKGDLVAPELIVPSYGDWKGNPDLVILFKEAVDRTLFALPPEIQEQSRRKLLELGLDESKWFIVLHMREDGYRSAVDHPRSIREIERYFGLIRHIVEAGGQVVRLGDTLMKRLPDMPGLIDLALVPESFLTQAYACSTARFLFGSSSSPAIIATGFNTPTAFANALNPFGYLSASKNNIIATKKIHMPDGSVLRDSAAYKQGNAHEIYWYGKADQLEELATAELCELADLMLQRTSDAAGWTFRPVSPLPVWMVDGKINPEEVARRDSWAPIYFSDLKAELLR